MYHNCLNCRATFRFLLNNSNDKLEVLSFHVVFTVKLYTVFGLSPYHSHPSHSAREARALAKKPDSRMKSRRTHTKTTSNTALGSTSLNFGVFLGCAVASVAMGKYDGIRRDLIDTHIHI